MKETLDVDKVIRLAVCSDQRKDILLLMNEEGINRFASCGTSSSSPLQRSYTHCESLKRVISFDKM